MDSGNVFFFFFKLLLFLLVFYILCSFKRQKILKTSNDSYTLTFTSNNPSSLDILSGLCVSSYLIFNKNNHFIQLLSYKVVKEYYASLSSILLSYAITISYIYVILCYIIYYTILSYILSNTYYVLLSYLIYEIICLKN